jgi:hypothetical protein
MASNTDKTADRVRSLFNRANGGTRINWEKVNQQGYDFANDNQMTAAEKKALEEQGMPTFTINRITPVVEMLNFYSTANSPRWQAIGTEGSDVDVAAVFSDMADYIWYNSDGPAIYGNTINDAITKGLGYMLVTVDKDADNGMGEVIIEQPDPFDIYVDPKARDLLFRDASFVLIRKVLPKTHIMELFPEFKSKIKKASANESQDFGWTEKVKGAGQKDFHYKDIDASEGIDPKTGEQEQFLELFELWERKHISYINVFYQDQPTKEQLKQIQEQVQVQMEELKAEKDVALQEQMMQLEQAVQSGEMIQARYDLEIEKLKKANEEELEMAEQQMTSELIGQIQQVQNQVVTEKEYDILVKDPSFAKMVIEVIPFHKQRMYQTCVVGDKTLYEKELPDKITQYPLVPFSFKWTGTPYPTSAVSPLVGKQRELNKAHQIMVHNASLGSSLRFMHEEGSIDTDHWEKYSSSPGALLPIRPGANPPTPILPAPLSTAFFQIVQEGKGDMEYLAGIYSSMQGDVSGQHETYRGMLAQDEYGTRRVKAWMKNVIEPALKQLGLIVMEYSQAVYTAHKVFRIVQPSALQEQRKVEINIPMYNDLGEAIGKYHDYGAAKFDIRIIAGSTLPVNRWAYLAELKELLQFGVVDDIAVLAETDIRNKEQIAKRKSLYAQLSGQVEQLGEAIKDKDGTIETLERQLVQAGIKGKVMAAEVEIAKQKAEVKADTKDVYRETKAKQKLLQQTMASKADVENTKLGLGVQQAIKNAELNAKKDLQGNNNSS